MGGNNTPDTDIGNKYLCMDGNEIRKEKKNDKCRICKRNEE